MFYATSDGWYFLKVEFSNMRVFWASEGFYTEIYVLWLTKTYFKCHD